MSSNEETEPAKLFELPEFEGQIPVAVETKLTGSGQRITRGLHHGEKITLLVEAEVSDIRHPKHQAGLKRVQILSVADLYELEGKDGVKLLSKARLAAKQLDDKRTGRQALPTVDEQVAVHTDHGQTLDETGTVLTPEEVAAVKGETVSELHDLPMPVILVFSDESECLWPDDYDAPNLAPGGEPVAGDFLVNPQSISANELQILYVLDPVTRDLLEEWTPADEDARLLKLEQEAKEKEDAEEKPKKAKKSKLKKTETEENPAPVLDADDDIEVQ